MVFLPMAATTLVAMLIAFNAAGSEKANREFI
jgi:hypothetical protein